MRFRPRFIPLSAVVALLAWPGASARAQNVDCASAVPTEMDQLRETSIQDATADEERWFRFETFARRSYCVEAVSAPWHSVVVDTELSLWEPTGGCTVPVTGTSAPANDDGDTEPSLYRGSRVCFASTGGVKYAQVNSCCQPTPNSAAASISVYLRFVETTLFSPYWQVVTAAGYDAAPQVKNNTSDPVNIYMTVYDQNGSPNATCDHMQHTIPANGLFTVALSSHCGISTGFGTMVIAHDGPPGAVSANITTFSGVSGLSFDAAFDVREKNVPTY